MTSRQALVFLRQGGEGQDSTVGPDVVHVLPYSEDILECGKHEAKEKI